MYWNKCSFQNKQVIGTSGLNLKKSLLYPMEIDSDWVNTAFIFYYLTICLNFVRFYELYLIYLNNIALDGIKATVNVLTIKCTFS